MERPRVWTRLQAVAHGEVSAEILEAYRGASLTVLDLMEEVETARDCSRRLGASPWDHPGAEAARTVAAWNAYVHQTLGTAILDADYRSYPRTAGFVPPSIAAQVGALFRPVEGWIGRAKRAASDPNYRLDVPLPAVLPPWHAESAHPETQLRGMREALRAIRDRACTAVAALGATPPEDEISARRYHAIHGLLAAAETKAEYVEDLCGARPAHVRSVRGLAALVGPTLEEAIATMHRVGQLAAMPRLADGPAPRVIPPSLAWTPPVPGAKHRTAGPLPGEPGFDPWCLTDRLAKRALAHDPEAKAAIDRLWRFDPDPEATLALLESIRAAERRGDVGRAVGFNDKPVGHFFACPWGTVYITHRAQRLGDHWLGAHQQFVLDVSAEGIETGHGFQRGLKVGDFQRTDEIDFGDSAAPLGR